MRGAEVEFDLTGAVKMVKALDKMGVSVQPAVDKAAQKALTPVRRAVRDRAPVGETGNLKAAVGRKKEKTKYSGKRVYEVTFSKKYNAVLQRPIKEPGIYGGKNTKGYYPASMEYGYLMPKPGGGIQFRMFTRLVDNQDKGAKYKKKRKKELVIGVQSIKVEGQHYMQKGAEASEGQAKQIMITTMEKELDKLWQEATHK